jgi:PBP1b-binding outer membrane lipoprotein LpoB
MNSSQFLVMAAIVLSGCVDMQPTVNSSPTVPARTVPVCQQYGGSYQCQWIELTSHHTNPVRPSDRRIVL